MVIIWHARNPQGAARILPSCRGSERTRVFASFSLAEHVASLVSFAPTPLSSRLKRGRYCVRKLSIAKLETVTILATFPAFRISKHTTELTSSLTGTGSIVAVSANLDLDRRRRSGPRRSRRRRRSAMTPLMSAAYSGRELVSRRPVFHISSTQFETGNVARDLAASKV